MMQAARGVLDVSGEKIVESAALLVVRPRAWNMDESVRNWYRSWSFTYRHTHLRDTYAFVVFVQHMIVNGHVVPGALFDFGVHLFQK